MPRKRARGTGYLGTDKGLRELYPRLGLDEAARSQSTALHNRRKPGLLSTGTPELAEGAVTNAKISDVNASKVDAGTLADARIPQLAKGKIQADGAWAENDIPNLGKGKIKADGTWAENDIPNLGKGKIQAAGRWAKDDQHADTVYKGDLNNLASKNDVSSAETSVRQWVKRNFRKK